MEAPEGAAAPPARRSPAPAAGASSAAGLRRLRVIAAVAPVVFIVGLQVLRPVLFDRLWPVAGDAVVSGLTAAAAVFFGLVVLSVVDRLFEADRHRVTVAERERIARELHDSTAQVLGATQLRLAAVQAHPAVQRNEDLADVLADIGADCQAAYRDVREAILGLRETHRDDRTLLEGLRSYADAYSRQSGIRTVVQVSGGEPELTPHREVQAVRVVQEALTNVRKHSGARSARLLVQQDDEHVSFHVEDDGEGFDTSADHADPAGLGGYGLSAMRERAELVGGRLVVDSRPGSGTRVSLHLPRGDRRARLAEVLTG